ncbi:MAG: hypothetical protein ABIG61_13770 [Planctomycetota bacterium]
MKKFLLTTVVLFTLSTFCLAEPPSLKDKKIIAFGGGGPGGIPDIAFLHDNITKMETALPVDGILISANPTIDGTYIYWADAWFGSRKFSLTDFEPLIKLLQDTKPQKFTANYLRLNTLPADVDWFDDDSWAAILNNAQIAATIVHQGRLAGIFLDTEQYLSASGIAPFSYNAQKQQNQHTFEQYQQKVKERAAQLINTFAAACPGINIVLTFATSAVSHEIGHKGQLPLTASSMPFMPAFVDGLLAPNINANIYDGYERSYTYMTHKQFAEARQIIKNTGARLSNDTKNYEKLKTAFGIWPAASEDQAKFNQQNVLKNTFTPKDIEHAVSFALEESDGLVWIYLGGTPVFHNFNLSQKYKTAITRAKLPHKHDYIPFHEARKKPEKHGIIIEAEDMNPVKLSGSGDMEILDSEIGLQSWGQQGKMVAVVTGINATGTVRFTFPNAIENGSYALRLRLQYPNEKHTTTFQWRDGLIENAKGSVIPLRNWTAVRMGNKAKGTWVGYAGWTWVQLYANKKFNNVAPNEYFIEIKDDNNLTYNFVYLDQAELVLNKSASPQTEPDANTPHMPRPAESE